MIVIIDSGICKKHNYFKDKYINGVSIINKDGKFMVCDNIDDQVGHGTAVSSIIYENVKDTDVFNIKITDSVDDIKVDFIIAALKYVDERLHSTKLINLSLGLYMIEEVFKRELEDLCYKLHKKGIVIVCANSNNGFLSYPAIFMTVVGVGWWMEYVNPNKLIYSKNSDIQIYGGYGNQYLPWCKNSYKFCSGSSFIAPIVSSKIYNIIQNRSHDISLILEEISEKTYFRDYKKQYFEGIEIKKVITYPFNKEIKTIISNIDFGNFDVIGIYDTKFSQNLGKRVCDCMHTESNLKIDSVNRIIWNDSFDCVILGHFREHSVINNEELLYLVKNAIINKKMIYSLDDISEIIKIYDADYSNYFCPKSITNSSVVNNYGYKYYINAPVVGIFGTNKNQGKFSLQVLTKACLEKEGYIVGFLSTEPIGYLFNADEQYHIGYDSKSELSNYQEIAYYNSMLYNIDNKNPNIIILGSQSHTIPEFEGSLLSIPTYQSNLLYGCYPDASILLIYFSDSIEYIIRTIKFLESTVNSKVILIVISSYNQDDLMLSYEDKYKKISKLRRETCKEVVEYSDVKKDNTIIINVIEKEFAE